jgi:hypothetical protein
VTDHLVKSFEKILAGVPASKALGLQAGQGNKRTRSQQLREQMIAAEVEYLYAQRGRGSLDYAITTVAGRYSRADSTVRKIYQSEQRKRRHIAKTIGKETKK